MNGLCKSREQTLPCCTKVQFNTATSVLKVVHMDLTSIKGGESLNKKRYIYLEVVRTACLYLEQSYQHARTLITPYVIRKRILILIRNRKIHLNHHLNEGMMLNEMKPIFFGGLRNLFSSTPSQEEIKEGKTSIRVTKKDGTTPGTKHPVIEGVPTIKQIHQNMDNQDTKMDDMKATKYGTYELHRNSKEGKYTIANYKKVCQTWFDKK